MGYKGVSRCRPEKSKSLFNHNITGSSNTRPGKNSSVRSLVKDKDTYLNKRWYEFFCWIE